MADFRAYRFGRSPAGQEIQQVPGIDHAVGVQIRRSTSAAPTPRPTQNRQVAAADGSAAIQVALRARSTEDAV